jgi:hypothetical protein
LSFKIRKITIGKGKTVGNEKAGWTRVHYELEAEFEDEQQLELAKGSMETLLDAWLRGEKITTEEKPSWDSGKVKWTEEEGFKGRYEKSEDFDNLEFKAMLKDLQEHKARMWHQGYFYWVFENGATVGRKKKEKKTGQETP